MIVARHPAAAGRGRTAQNRWKLRAGLAAFVAFSLFVCVITGGASARAPARQIEFTPHVTPVQFTATPPGPGLSLLSSPQAPTATPFVSQDGIPVGTDEYPVGDEFQDASGLQLAGVQSDPTGRYGIATIMYQPDYRRIWITDESGVRRYLIVHRDDPLYSGENGFLQHFNQYMAAIRGENASLTSGGTGAGTIMGLGLAGCLPSVGWGCVAGLVGGTIVMLAGISGSLYFAIFEVGPEREALNTMFQTIEANRGTVRPDFGAG